MICKKDVESGKAFWVAAIASRVIMSNGEEAERKACKVFGWYLLDTDDEYWLYFVEDIHHVNYAMGARVVAYPAKEPYAIYDKSKYEYELEDGSIVIREKKTLVQSFLKVTCQGRAGVEEVLDGLEKILESFADEKLTSLQYELDMFREDFNDFLHSRAGRVVQQAVRYRRIRARLPLVAEEARGAPYCHDREGQLMLRPKPIPEEQSRAILDQF